MFGKRSFLGYGCVGIIQLRKVMFRIFSLGDDGTISGGKK
jgi:hypothetical protein